MTMRGQRYIHTQTVKSRLRRRLQLGHFVFVCLYVAYIALVLPFICWGATAQPGHPHLRPHFVFTDPVVIPDATAEGSAHPPAHTQTQHSSSNTLPDHENPSTSLVANTATPTGRAAPTLFAFAVLFLVILSVLSVVPAYRPPLVILLPTFFPKLTMLVVPVPPPRLVIS
jgi:hypothetical protein